MSFLKFADPIKREQTVKEFLAIKKNIRANELAEKTGKIELREDLSEFFKPVTKTQKETQKEIWEAITKGLEPIRTGIEQLHQRLPQQLPQQIGYPFSEATSGYRSSSPTLTELTEEPTTSKEEEEEPTKNPFSDSDTIFGVYKKGDKFFLGDKAFDFDEKKLYIGDYKFKNTPGLMHLITSKKPIDRLFETKDKEAY